MDTRELFERYGDAVFRLAWSCTGSRQDAEDVTQTVFLKVLERRPDLEPGKERAWLFRVAVNECRSLWRRLKLRRTEPLEEALAGIDLSGYIKATEKGQPGGVATLGPDGKVPGEQLPKMDYDPAGSAEAVQKNLTAHTGNKNNPHAVTAEQVGALASSGGVMSGAISMSGHKIANLAAPADSTDAANKQYVDEHAGARVILGSYVGTGKTGKSNPNQITLAEPFKILCIYGMQSNNYYKSIDGYGNGETSNIIHSSIIPTEYTKGISFGFGYRYSSRDSYGKKSTDGKTFSWYFDLTTPDATSEQLNASGTVYYYYAIV